MLTGWINVSGTWYYANASGAMVTGWLNIGGTWFYLDGSGAMVANGWRSWAAPGTGSAIPARWLPAGSWQVALGTMRVVRAHGNRLAQQWRHVVLARRFGRYGL